MPRFLSTNVLLITLLILAVIFERTSACTRRRRHHRHYGKRSIDNSNNAIADDNDISGEPVEIISESTSFDGQRHRQTFPREHRKRNLGNSDVDWLNRDVIKIPTATKIKYERTVKMQRKAERIEKSLPPFMDTSCREVLCSESPNYPTAAIAKVIDESRKILKSGVQSIVFKNRGMNLDSFVSKIHDSETFSTKRMTTNAKCYGSRNVTFPLEGYNRKHRKSFYIVNIPGFHQGVCTNVCSSNKKDSFQGYTEEKLVVLPTGQQQFRIQDLKIRKIVVPYDCPKKVF